MGGAAPPGSGMKSKENCYNTGPLNVVVQLSLCLFLFCKTRGNFHHPQQVAGAVRLAVNVNCTDESKN